MSCSAFGEKTFGECKYLRAYFVRTRRAAPDGRPPVSQ